MVPPVDIDQMLGTWTVDRMMKGGTTDFAILATRRLSMVGSQPVHIACRATTEQEVADENR